MTKPATYDSFINSGTSDYQRDKKGEIHDESGRWWYVRKGIHRGMRENFMDTLDETHYEQLEHCITGNQGINIGDFFKHLKGVWCSLDMGVIGQRSSASGRGLYPHPM